MPPKINYRKPVYGKHKKAETRIEEIKVDAEKKKNFIEELDILDYSGRRNPRMFDDAKKKLEVYVSKNYDPRNAHIFKYNAAYDFPELAAADEDSFTPENDPHGFNKEMRKLLLKERFNDMKKIAENDKKIYAILWGQCTNSMQHRIEMDEHFPEYDETQDLSRLWGRIGELLLTGAGELQNVLLLRVKTQSEFEKVRQYRNESVGDFYHRFNNELISLEASGIDIPEQPQLAIQFLHKLDSVRFAALLAELENAASRGQDLYPATVNEAMVRAQNYKVVMPRFDPNGNSSGVVFNVTTSENKNYDSKKSNFKETKNYKGKKDFKKMTKSPVENGNMSEDGQEKKKIECWFCGKTGHFKYNCPDFLKAKDVNVTFCCNIAHSSDEPERIFDILADNQATVSIFKEKELLKNIRKIKEKVTINGIGGKIIVNEIGDYDFFGEVYYSPNASANVLCFHDLQEKFEVIYDDITFTVKLPNDKEIQFTSQEKLYYNPLLQINESCNVQTVESNQMLYSKREVKRADDALELKRKLGYPSTADMIKMISTGAILNCPVTVADIKRAINIYGPDLASLKGKTVTRKSRIAYAEKPVIKFQNAEITLCIDIMYINGISFLITVSEDLGLLMIGELKSKNINHIKDVLNTIINYYRSASFVVKMIKTDGESAVIALSTYFNGRGIIINQTGKNQHVPQIERKIRQIKERVRAHINILPFKITKQLLSLLTLYCVQLINIIPTNINNSNLSPKELFSGRKLDLSRDMRISFGDYVQIHDDNGVGKNSMSSRTTDAIAIKMKDNLQGTAEFFHYQLGKLSLVTNGHFYRCQPQLSKK